MAILTVNIDTPPIPTGNTLWVDAVNGDDATGMVDRQDLPFLTLAAAKTAAGSGDTVYVRPGSYTTDANLAKNGVNWHFCNGAVVTLESDGTVDLFGDGGAAMSFTISGNGVLRIDPTDAAAVCHGIAVSNASSVVHVECLDIINVGTVFTSDFCDPIHQDGGELSVVCRDILSLGQATAYPVWWEDGAMNIRARNIYQKSTGSGGTVVSLFSVNMPTGEAYIQCDTIESTIAGSNAIDQGVLVSPTADSTAKCWINALQIRVPLDLNQAQAVQKNGAGNLYITTQKISGQMNIAGSYGEAYIDTQKYQSSNTDDPTEGCISLLGATSFINIGKLTDGENDDALILVNGGTHYLNIADFTRSFDGTGVLVESGTLTLSAHIDTSVDAAAVPIQKNGGTLVLKDCTLIAEATQPSIDAATAQTINAEGANTIYQAVGANVTVEGNMQLDNGAAPFGNVPIANADGTWSWGDPVIQVTGLTLLDSGWSLVGGLYEYDLANVNILATSIVEVIPDNDDASIVQAAVFLPRTDSSSGSVKVYATNEPTGDIGVTINIYNQ